MSSENNKYKLTFEFDNDATRMNFAVWLSEMGEQDYWEWMECREQEEEGDITAVTFDYHPVKDPTKSERSSKRYGKFIEDNTIRAVSGRNSKEEEEDE